MKNLLFIVTVLTSATACQSTSPPSQIENARFRAELASLAPSYLDRLTQHEVALGRQLSIDEARRFLQNSTPADSDKPMNNR